MAFPNLTDVVTSTQKNRSKKVQSNITKSVALYSKLNASGRVKTFSGGETIVQELAFAENPNGGFFSGYELLPVGAADVLSAAEYDIKQYAISVSISGLDKLKNSSKEKVLDLAAERVQVAEDTMTNALGAAAYGDGTTFNGKAIQGLDLLVPTTVTSGVAGGIDRATWSFWQSKFTEYTGGTLIDTSAEIQSAFNAMWASLVKPGTKSDLIVVDANIWQLYVTSLQAQQRFTDASSASLGFPTVKFMDCDVVLDGGIGGSCPTGTAFFLNTKTLFLRPHADCNCVPLGPKERVAINQDATVSFLGWAGNMTASELRNQGRIYNH